MANRILRPSHYGSEDGLHPKNFPDCVDPEYFEAWTAYCTTKTAQDLYNRQPAPYGMTLAVQGFISYINTLSTKILIKSVKSPMRESQRLFDLYMKSIRSNIEYPLTRNLFLSKFRLSDVHVVLDSKWNRVSNVLSVGAHVYLVMSPKPERGKTPKVGSILHTFKQAWFREKEPEQLFKTDNLTKKLKRSAIPNVPDTYPQIQQLFGKPALWFPWIDNAGIDIARVRGNAVAIHFYIPPTLVFLCTVSKADMEKSLVKKIKNSF